MCIRLFDSESALELNPEVVTLTLGTPFVLITRTDRRMAQQAVYKKKSPQLCRNETSKFHTNVLYKNIFLIEGLRNKMYKITYSWVIKKIYTRWFKYDRD